MSLLLDQTRSKIDALIRTVEGLRELDYPFVDPRNVLNIILDEFAALRADLSTKNPGADRETTKTICRRALEAIENYLPVLGFISRSGDLEAPVELHGPLLRLTRQAVQSDAQLVIFSEWNYSPFTFLFPELAKRGVVLVGMPRSESHNALVAPLSGHELGHNIWQKESLAQPFQEAALELILQEMQSNFDRWKALLQIDKAEQLSDLMGFKYWEHPLTWAVRQIEETFCDLIGLLIFREAYIYAFQYLLAPGASLRRAYHYPDLCDRARVLCYAAKRIGVLTPERYEESFEVSEVEADDLVRQYVQLADKVCTSLVDKLLDRAEELVRQRKLSAYSKVEVAEAKKALARGVPMMGAKGVENILIAAWELLLDEKAPFAGNVPAVKGNEKDLVLNELVLKSFEVFEVEHRVAQE